RHELRPGQRARLAAGILPHLQADAARPSLLPGPRETVPLRMSVNKDVFRRRDFNYDFQQAGQPPVGWTEADRVPETVVRRHCALCGVQCGMYLRVSDGQVTGVEPRHFPHNEGHLCPKGIVAYQQVGHPDRLRYPMLRRGGKGSPLERCTWDEALDYVVRRWKEIQAEHGRDAVAVC